MLQTIIFRVHLCFFIQAFLVLNVYLPHLAPLQECAAMEFNETFCTYVYSGQFLVGGWLRSIAAATSNTKASTEFLTKVGTFYFLGSY